MRFKFLRGNISKKMNRKIYRKLGTLSFCIGRVFKILRYVLKVILINFLKERMKNFIFGS